MRLRVLGRTGWRISEIGFGGWGIGKDLWVGAEDSTSVRSLHKAIDLGVNFIDTALAYGDGHGESLVGQVVGSRSERIYVATKVPPGNWKWPAQGSLREVFPRSHIRTSAERSLKNLGVERIDLLQLHVWDPGWTEEDEWYEALVELREEGKIDRFGISINDHQPESALEVVSSGRVDTVQVIYNIFEQSPEDRLFPLCRENRVGVIARVPFDEGALTGKITAESRFPKKDWRNFYFRGERKREVQDRVEELSTLLDQETPDLPALALKFCLNQESVGVVIPGMRTVEHVEQNLKVSDQPPLSGAQIQALRSHRWVKNFYQRS